MNIVTSSSPAVPDVGAFLGNAFGLPCIGGSLSLPHGFRAEFEQVTMYCLGVLGYRKIEARNLIVQTERYAQYENAVRFVFVPRRKRKRRRLWECYKPTTVVLAGWGHPEIQSPFDEGGLSRYGSRDAGWNSEFDRFLEQYQANIAVTILIDLRRHDPEELKNLPQGPRGPEASSYSNVQ